MPAGSPELPDWGQVDTGDGYFELTTGDPTRTLHTVTGWAIEHDLAFETIDAERVIFGHDATAAAKRRHGCV